MKSVLTSFEEATGLVDDGALLTFGGAPLQRAPMEFIRELVRRGKMFTMHFFFRYELPKILGLEKRLMDSDGLTVEMEAQFFND